MTFEEILPIILPAIVAVASAISALVPDSKMGTFMARIVNFAALNMGQAKNDRDQS